MHRHPGVEIAFTDRRGRHWIRRARGELVKTKSGALRHYGLPEPVSFAALEEHD